MTLQTVTSYSTINNSSSSKEEIVEKTKFVLRKDQEEPVYIMITRVFFNLYISIKTNPLDSQLTSLPITKTEYYDHEFILFMNKYIAKNAKESKPMLDLLSKLKTIIPSEKFNSTALETIISVLTYPSRGIYCNRPHDSSKRRFEIFVKEYHKLLNEHINKERIHKADSIKPKNIQCQSSDEIKKLSKIDRLFNAMHLIDNTWTVPELKDIIVQINNLVNSQDCVYTFNK